MGKSLDSSAVAFHRAEGLDLEASVVTVGAFNEEHRGHRELLRRTEAAAQPRDITVGEDFCFGSCKNGTAHLPERYFNTRIPSRVRCGNGEIVSSSRIRVLRRSGMAAAAAALENWNDAPTVPLGNRSNAYELRTVNS